MRSTGTPTLRLPLVDVAQVSRAVVARTGGAIQVGDITEASVYTPAAAPARIIASLRFKARLNRSAHAALGEPAHAMRTRRQSER